MKFPIVLCAIMSIGFLAQTAHAKILAKCDIVEALERFKFPRSFLSNWLCLIQAESGGDTRKVTTGSLSSKYGLFQIDSKEWCGKGFVGGLCNVQCEALLTDAMDANNVACAKEYYKRNGFKGWSQWESKCKNPSNLPNIRDC